MATQSIRPAPTASSSHRHHPYAPSSTAAASSSKQPNNRKWTSTNPSARGTSTERQQAPPSPSRSRRDHSESPPAGLQAAFGGREGGKWWDEEIPAPPASLSSILDSFRRSGEGDRDLLLAILGAKKAEEDRLTALIQTRLTILQARLNVHAAANVPSVTLPTPSETVYSPRPPTEILAYVPERTPSLTSRGSASSSSAGPVSPAEQQSNHLYPSYDIREKRQPAPESLYLPPPTNLWRRHEEGTGTQLKAEYVSKARSIGRASPTSPRSENGLDMLLDAGRRVETRAE